MAQKKKGCLAAFVAVCAAVVIIVGVCFALAGIRGRTEAYGTAWASSDVFDIENYSCIEISGEKLKIMQLADPQMKFGWFTQDVKTMKLIEKMLDDEKPDIVVCTGDLTLSINTYSTYKYFADFMENRKQYWTLTYGNHDAEFDCSKYTLWKLLSGYKYCLFDCGPNNIDGESNHLVTVKRGGEYVYGLIMLDSNMYQVVNVNGTEAKEYDWIHENQVEWYKWVCDGLSSVNPSIKTSAFWHIPTIEFAKMYYADNADRAVSDGVDVSGFAETSDVCGYVFENDKSGDDVLDSGYKIGILYGAENIGENKADGANTMIFDAIVEKGVTEAVFCGHDHVNTLRGYYDGVYLCYGKASGYHTYPFFETSNWLTRLLGFDDDIVWNGSLRVENGNVIGRGMTFIEVDFDGGFSVFDK